MNQRLRFVVVGSAGQLGGELVRSIENMGEVIALDRAALDITDFPAVRRILHETRPDVILNAAAYTNVDGAEREGAEATRVNGEAPGVVAECAAREGSVLIHFSTDYVFSGDTSGSYSETDIAAPINVYGQSKLVGEHAVLAAGGRALVFRISWLYGLSGKNFLTTICRLAETQSELRVVADQFGCPTWARSVARSTASLFAEYASGESDIREFDYSGLFHMASADHTTWYDLACAIVQGADLQREGDVVVSPIPSSAYPTIAKRPARSVLDSSKLWQSLGIRLPSWREQLEECLSSYSMAKA